MNFVELYRTCPGNYYIHSENEEQISGGSGKTTQLLHFVQELMGESVKGRIVIPIYVKLSELNIMRIESGILYQYITKHFNNCVSEKAVDEMIKKSKAYDIVFVLDGFNELNDYLVYGQTVHTYIKNDIRRLSEHENVHFIISTRKKQNLFDGEALGDTFSVKRVAALTRRQILDYLQIDSMEEMSEPLKKIVSNPMLLKMFNTIYKKDSKEALSLSSIYELIQKFFLIDTAYKKDKRWSDNLISVREYVIETVLPLAAFKIECALLNMRENGLEKYSYDEFMDEILEECDIPLNMNKEQILAVIEMTGLLNHNLVFQHELIRDYLAVKGIQSGKNVAKFFKLLSENMKYIRKNGMEFVRRTKFMDLAEFIYADKEDRLYGFLRECGVKEALELAENFYYDLASLYEDLNDKQKSGEVGIIAIGLLEKREICDGLSGFKVADKYNCLYYCVNMKMDINPIQYLEKAKANLMEISDDEWNRECTELKGRILSNFGSYYYAKKEFEQALEWHKKALEYRLQENLIKDAVSSYRTVMSDYFQMHAYEKAYQTYCEGIKNIDVIPVDFMERAMGSEIKLLKAENIDQSLREEIIQKLKEQIVFIYNHSIEAKRKNRKMLKNLYTKLQELGDREELKEIAREYEEKCKDVLL